MLFYATENSVWLLMATNQIGPLSCLEFLSGRFLVPCSSPFTYMTFHRFRIKALCWWLCLLSCNKTLEDTQKLQNDIDRLGSWARRWGMRFQPTKCNIMQLTRKRIKKINATYELEGTLLENVESIKYLGVTITNDLRWNTHISNVCTKANKTLGFLRRNLSACPQNIKKWHTRNWFAQS